MAKRLKYDEVAVSVEPAGWHRMPINRQCEVDLARDIYFVDGSRADHVRMPGLRQQPYDKLPQVHDDGSPMSVCYRYVTWVDGMSLHDNDAVHAMYADIEVWTAPWGDLYFYRAPDVSALPRDVPRNATKEPLVRAKTPNPCQQVTLNLLDPNLAARMQHSRMECLFETNGKVKRVITEGPLSFQEPPGYDWELEEQFGPQVKFEYLNTLLRLGDAVELPSVEAQALTLAYEAATGYTIMWGTDNESYYVPNLPAIPSISAEEVRIGAPSVKARTPNRWLWPVLKLVSAGVLTVRRVVFKYGIANMQDTTRMITEPRLRDSNIPVYIAVEELNDDVWREIESTGVKNFIVPERFQSNPPDAYRVLMSQADQIIFRPFYEDLAR